MQETEIHDLSDDADYAASQQQGSVTLSRCNSSKRSSVSEPEGAEIVYLKDNVTIHPTQYGSERISGRLKLIKLGPSLFMTWIPYSGQSSNARLSESDRNLYTIRAVSFMDVSSIHRHTPTLGWQYIIVVLSSGLAFPPLYFYNGGVKEFLATIKQHVLLVRSAEDANVFLVNDFQDRLQRTLSSLELPRAVAVATGPSSPISDGGPPSYENQERTEVGTFDGSASLIQHNGRQRQKFHDPARDISIQLLEKFSLVTRLARETTSQLFRDSDSDVFGANERRNHDQTPHPYPSIVASNNVEEVPNEIPIASDPLEFDKLTLVWGKPRQPPLGFKEWLIFFDSEGRIMDSKALRKRIFYGGVDHRLRKEVWPFLLGHHAYDSTCAEREYLVSVKKSEYETIKNQWQGMSDLLSPILFVMRDESESFWCFVALMERLGPNFNRDQNGMHSQLFALLKLVELLDSPLHNYFKQNDCLNYFFCFRWVLIQFKREFEFERTMRLWEVLWTRYISEHLHLYVCVAILKRYRRKIMGEQMDFDTLLKFINELSGHIDLDAILRDAEALCICAGENGAACIPPGTPPSLSIEDGLLYSQQDDEVL
ncbi:TBC1 domain family member 17 isoform X2 [Camellia sinensis]|uniref:TBC1 domain family member 17 isoform X2 n=1 Tax=Camellia sinensis TaxID=4442 RepID=UPI0010368BF5|nr:TBC1 domain family member 17 isoform X2 [Camellia sinensis]